MFPLWLALQLLTLALAAGRVPLSARFPQPIERQAAAEMVIIQIAAASLLFPALLRGGLRWALVVASVLPLLTLAWLLSGEPTARILLTGGYVIFWLSTLAIYANLLSTERQRMLCIAAVSLWTIGGPFLLYLHKESAGTSQTVSAAWNLAAGPIAAALALLQNQRINLLSALPLAVIFAIGIFLRLKRIFRPSPIAHRLSTDF